MVLSFRWYFSGWYSLFF